MQTSVSIDNKHCAVVLEMEGIDPAKLPDIIMAVFSCAIRLCGADSPISVQEDSQINSSDAETEYETESKE